MSKTTETVEPLLVDAGFTPLGKLTTVLCEFDLAEIRYCHWKSNYHIQYALSGKEDLDLLVAQQDFAEFARILLRHGFKQAESETSRRQPGVFHFLGNDESTGTLINVHAYTRILTGDHFLKSWALPLDRVVLSDTRTLQGIRLPSKAAELIVFVIRNMIKQTTLLDLYLGRRSRQAVREEYEWLTSGIQMEDCFEKLATYFPMISRGDFQSALDLIGTKGASLARIRMGLRFTRLLSKYRRYGRLRQTWGTASAVCRVAFGKLWKKRKTMTFQTGGKIIALIGPQATGKSSLAERMRQWLGQELAVRTVHVGRSPATFLCSLPAMFIPLARKLFKRQRTCAVDKRVEVEADYNFPYLYLLRKIMLACDRRKLLCGLYRATRNGEIVICDRYPSDNAGAIDGPSFRPNMIDAQTSWLKRCLMEWESRIYREICPPDLVLELTVSVDVAVQRNLVRNKKLPQDTAYVLQRHAMRHKPRFDGAAVVPISTDGDLEETVLEVKNTVWRHL